jgi:hypothetical protein
LRITVPQQHGAGLRKQHHFVPLDDKSGQGDIVLFRDPVEPTGINVETTGSNTKSTRQVTRQAYTPATRQATRPATRQVTRKARVIDKEQEKSKQLLKDLWEEDPTQRFRLSQNNKAVIHRRDDDAALLWAVVHGKSICRDVNKPSNAPRVTFLYARFRDYDSEESPVEWVFIFTVDVTSDIPVLLEICIHDIDLSTYLDRVMEILFVYFMKQGRRLTALRAAPRLGTTREMMGQADLEKTDTVSWLLGIRFKRDPTQPELVDETGNIYLPLIRYVKEDEVQYWIDPPWLKAKSELATENEATAQEEQIVRGQAEEEKYRAIQSLSDPRLKTLLPGRPIRWEVSKVPLHLYEWKDTRETRRLWHQLEDAGLILASSDLQEPFWSLSADDVKKVYPEAVRLVGKDQLAIVKWDYVPVMWLHRLMELNSGALPGLLTEL